MKILVAEDDENIRNGLYEIFDNEGYDVVTAINGAEALKQYKTEKPDMLCLDVMMPEASGFDVCREIRKSDANIPIIFLTAKGQEIDKVMGLEIGADDYIVKPFGVHEVVARVRAITRRALQNKSIPASSDESFVVEKLDIDPSELKARRDGQEIDLSLREVKILKLFHDYKGKVVDRDTLLDHCWGEHVMPESRTVDQHIAALRKKIEADPKNPEIIKTVHNAGYRYE